MDLQLFRKVHLICIGILFLTIGTAFAQKTVTGKVTSSDGNETLPGVNILIKGTSSGTVTDIDGGYTLSDVPSDATLVFSYVGYTTVEEIVGDRTTINVVMGSSEVLDEVVVIGYTSVRKAVMTSSATTLNSEAITDNVTSDFGSMLQGKVSGLMVTNSSGAPGSEANLVIRGVGTITAGKSPLFVVDGIPGGTYDPNDVETVTVLKDVGSTAIYGAEGANGVIVITTKQGKRNQAPKITVRVNAALTQALFGRFKPMDGEELYNLWESWGIPNFEADFPQTLKQRNYDWLGNTFKTGNAQDYYASVTGGTKNTSYMVSLNHYNQKGTMPGTSYKRSNIRLNFNAQLSSTLDLSVRMNMRENKKNNLWSNTFSEMAYRGIPWDNPFDENGDPVNIAGIPTADQRWFYANRQNPWHGYQYNYNKEGGTRMNLDLVLNWHILPWLTATNTVRLERAQRWEKVYYDSRDASQTWNGITQGSHIEDNSSYPLGGYKNTTLLKASHRIGNHDLGGLVGYEFSEDKGDYRFGATADQQPIGMEIVSAGAATTMRATGGYATPRATWSAFTQLNYSYSDKYIATASFRADASSRFAPNNRVGFFPSMSVGWLASNEKFLKGNKVLTFLKIRGSFGLTGNADIGDFAYMDAYTFSGVTYLGNPGAQPSSLANPDLGWEKCLMTSGGIDFKLFNWLEGSIDLYRNLNSDLLFSAPEAPSTGFYSYLRNIGKISNKGIEVQLTSTNIENKNLKWTTSFNIGFNKNRVEKLPGGEPGKPGTPIMVGAADAARQRLEEGHELYAWYMPEWRGVDPANGDPLWTSEDGGVTNDYSKAKIDWLGSSPTPKFSGGLLNNLSYKGFTFGMNILFVYGNRIYNGARASMDNDGRQAQYNQMSLDNGLGWSRWEKPGDIATHPLPVYGGNKNSTNPSSRFLENGSYLRIRNINIGYNIPEKVLSKLYIKNARVFLSGDNLLTFSKFSGPDPETDLTASGISNVAGSINYIYPSNRTFSLGVELNF